MNTSQHHIRRLFVAGALGAVATALVCVALGVVAQLTLFSLALGFVAAAIATASSRTPRVQPATRAHLVRPNLVETPLAA